MMKKVKFNVVYAVIIMVSMAFFSCSKAEDGAIGPVGPAGQIGPAGADGADGADGTNGTDGVDGQNGGVDGIDGADGQDGADGADGQDGADGRDGNANVIASGWYSFTHSEWQFTNTRKSVFSNNIRPEFTKEVIDDALILVYINYASTSNQEERLKLLPVISENYVFEYEITVASIKFSRNRTDGNDALPPAPAPKFRHVIIPASTSGKSSIDFKKMTYEEVMDHFGLNY